MAGIFDIDNYFLNPYGLPYFIVGVLAIANGFFVFFQNRKSLSNFSYLLLSAAAGIWLTGDGLCYFSKDYAIALLWARYWCWPGIIFITPSVYMFSVIWKDGSLAKRKKSIYVNFVLAFLTYLVCIFSSLLVEGVWKYPWGFYPKVGVWGLLFNTWFYILMVLSFSNFIHSFKKEISPVKKKQAKLLIIAFSIAFIGSLEFLPNYGVAYYLYAFIPIFFFIILVGYSVIQYRLFDIETVIHKTVAWLLANLILLVPFGALTYFSRPWYSKLSDIGIITYVCSMALVLIFLVRIFQPKIDHFFQRRLYNLEAISNRFISDATHLRGIAKLVARLEDTISATLYTQWVDIFIQEEEGGCYRLVNAKENISRIPDLWSDKPFLKWLSKYDKVMHKDIVEIDPAFSAIRDEAKKYFSLTGAVVVVPLILNERLLGIINLGKKLNLRRYSAMDFNFLTTLKNQSAIAISNSLLYENIEKQVRQRTQELVEVQRQLIQAEKLATVGTLAGGVAHEINNPLAVILTNAQMLLSPDGNFDIAEARESLELIEEATKRCREIVQKLMTYAKKPLETVLVSKVDVGQTIGKAIAFLRYQLEQENIKIITDIDQEKCFITGSNNELEQVFTNIILNGRDAIKKKGVSGNIYISLTQNEDTVKIIIRDEGIGMTEDVMGKIFDPFFTTKDVGKGLGLGLSICQSIIDKHKGTIFVKSKPNRGATFTIKLPRAKAAAGIE